MAQYSWDFQQDTPGQPPEGWEIDGWDYDKNDEPEVIVTDEGTLRLRSRDAQAFLYSLHPALLDVYDLDIVFRWRFAGVYGVIGGFLGELAGGGIQTQENWGAILEVYGPSARWDDYDYENGEPTRPPLDPNTWYFTRFRFVGDELAAAHWQADDPPPEEWDGQVQDPLKPSFSGQVGFGFYIIDVSAPATIEIDYIGIGIGGAPAPFPIDIAELSLRSATSTRAEATVAAPVDVTGRSVTPTRANVTLDTTIRVAGRTGTSTRTDAGLRAAVTLRGLSSATAIRAAGSLDTAAIYGARTSPPILLPDVVAESVAVTWEEDLPEGASILMQVSVNGGPWRTLRSGVSIPGLTGPLGGRSLVLRNLLGTTDPQALPVLKAPKIVIQERTPAAAVWLEWPQGVFLLSSPTRRADEAGGVIREIEAYDQLVVLRDDRVLDRYIIRAGTNYISAVYDLLQSAGIQQRNLFPSPLTLPADREWAPGTPKLEIINDLLAAINHRSLTFDAMGAAVAEPYVSPADAEPEYRYVTDGESVIAPEATEEMDLFNVANRWVLVVSEPDQEPLVAVYSNDNPESPTSTVNRGRVIVDFREYEEAANLDTLEARAQRIAFEASQVIQAIEWESWIMPHHGDSDVYELVLSPLGVAAKYSEHTWEMDLEPGGTMRHRARRVVPI